MFANISSELVITIAGLMILAGIFLWHTLHREKEQSILSTKSDDGTTLAFVGVGIFPYF